MFLVYFISFCASSLRWRNILKGKILTGRNKSRYVCVCCSLHLSKSILLLPRLVPHKITTTPVAQWDITQAVQNQIQGNSCYPGFSGSRGELTFRWLAGACTAHNPNSELAVWGYNGKVTNKCTLSRWASQAVTTGFSCSSGSGCGSSSARLHWFWYLHYLCL